jgi:hypothetical protein
MTTQGGAGESRRLNIRAEEVVVRGAGEPPDELMFSNID